MLKDHDAPGSGGMGAVFTCPFCGKTFVRTMDGQDRCLSCMKDPKTKDAVPDTLPLNGFTVPSGMMPIQPTAEPAAKTGGKTKFCPSCGAAVAENAKFCMSCGAVLKP